EVMVPAAEAAPGSSAPPLQAKRARPGSRGKKTVAHLRVMLFIGNRMVEVRRRRHTTRQRIPASYLFHHARVAEPPSRGGTAPGCKISSRTVLAFCALFGKHFEICGDLNRSPRDPARRSTRRPARPLLHRRGRRPGGAWPGCRRGQDLG